MNARKLSRARSIGIGRAISPDKIIYVKTILYLFSVSSVYMDN